MNRLNIREQFKTKRVKWRLKEDATIITKATVKRAINYVKSGKARGPDRV